jgi:hypothetical protein
LSLFSKLYAIITTSITLALCEVLGVL